MTAVDMVAPGYDRAGEVAPHFAVARWRDCMPVADEWDALAAAASEPNPFFERWFLTPSLASFDPEGRVVLAQLRVDGRLVGLAPLGRAGHYYGRPLPHLSLWLHANAFCGMPLVAQGFETLFWSSLLGWSDRQPGMAAFLHLPGMPEDCAPVHALTALATQTHRGHSVVEREARALLASDLSPADYFTQSLSTKKRKELRRQERRLAEYGTLEVVRTTDPVQVPGWADDYLALEAASWKSRAGSALADSPAHAQFFRNSLSGAAAQGRFEGLALHLDGRPIAMLATFLTPPGAFSFKTVYDESFARYSPGVLLQKENLDLLARDDIAWCDSCAAPDHPMIDHFWRGQRSMVALNLAIGGQARRTLGKSLIAFESRRFHRSSAE
ncbi:GNAT family N-acetyltransferase [Citromicrobium bathyomarinum]